MKVVITTNNKTTGRAEFNNSSIAYTNPPNGALNTAAIPAPPPAATITLLVALKNYSNKDLLLLQYHFY